MQRIDMVYYSRVFCQFREMPPLQEAINYANSKASLNKLIIKEQTLDEYSNGGKSFEMNYSLHKTAIPVDINPVDETDPIGKEEIQEFINDIGFAGFSSAKRKVINHLENTAFIIACEMPEDVDEDGQAAVHLFLQYYVQHCSGLLHADGEGFYNDDMTILLADK